MSIYLIDKWSRSALWISVKRC